MEYVFKEKLKFEEYDNFIKKQDYLSFMQEDKWAYIKDVKKHKIVGVKHNDKLCAVAHILIEETKSGRRFIIPNGYLLDFTNKELLQFMTNSIKKLGKMYDVYSIDIYPNIISSNPNYTNIHNNLINLNYKYKDEYIDSAENVLIPMKKNNKKISKLELKRKYEKNDFYKKRGIFFECSKDINDINRLANLNTGKYFNNDLIIRLLTTYTDRVTMIFAKLDLVFYKNYLIENENDSNELMKIEELLTISDEIDIGCALIIEPYNSKNNICEYIYNQEKESFEKLDISNGLLYEAMKICNKENYSYIKVSNLNLNVISYMEKYSAIPIKYIGHYSLILNKLTYFLNKEVFVKKTTTTN